ncbi:Clp protease ClpB [Paenibacillus larvae]
MDKTYRLPINLQLFAEGEGGESDGEQTKGEETTKTFTQEELDKIVADRLARERKKAEKYGDYDDIKMKLSEYERLAEEKRLADLSEQERLAEAAKKHEEEKQALASELEKVRGEIQKERITNEFIKAATGRVAYVDAALRLADLSGVKVKDGKVIGMDEVIEGLLKDNPFLANKPQQPVGSSTNPSGDSTQVDAKDTNPFQLLKMGYGTKV